MCFQKLHWRPVNTNTANENEKITVRSSFLSAKTVTGTSAVLNGLHDDMTYEVVVRAKNLAGNRSK